MTGVQTCALPIWGEAKNNPYSTMIPGTQDLAQYPNVPEAINQFAAGVGGPDVDPSSRGLERYLQYKKLNPKSTIEDFIKVHNPTDNPQGEINLLLQLAQELGV